MRGTAKIRARGLVDLILTSMLPFLMAYELIGETTHEVLGMTMLLLFLCHHALNFGWLKNIFRGHYTAQRIAYLAVTVLLLIVMLMQPLSGVLMSKHLFRFLRVGSAQQLARVTHLLLGHWGLLLMSFHAGMHVRPGKGSRRADGARLVAMAGIGVCGVRAAMRRRLPEYLFLKTQFAFFDFSEPLGLFVLDYLFIMAALACLGSGLMRVLMKVKRPRGGRKDEP